jgi:hypothetical protein
MTSLSASSTNGTALLTHSHNCSCYVSRRTLAPPPLWLQKHTDLRAHDFAHFPDLWQPIPPNITCAWRWKPCLINPLNAELNPICHFLALLEARHILHVSRIRVNPAINEGHGVVTSRKKALETQYRLFVSYYPYICPAVSFSPLLTIRVLCRKVWKDTTFIAIFKNSLFLQFGNLVHKPTILHHSRKITCWLPWVTHRWFKRGHSVRSTRATSVLRPNKSLCRANSAVRI